MASIKGPWKINGNGHPGDLWIEGVDAQGNLLPTCTVYGQPIRGFWDDASGRITFMRIINAADPSTIQVYTGHFMAPQAGATEAMAGTFEAFVGTGGSAKAPFYGWFATRR
jgi:hypothetical protein